MPCLCEDVQGENISSHQASSHGDDHKEMCTPFCSCAGCLTAVFFYQRSMQMPERLVFNIDKNHRFFTSYFSSYKSHNIWQPPRFS
jgi:hypothetical protein